MKTVLLALSLLSLPLAAQTTNNLPDSVDANKVPAAEESREGEIIDSRDSIDLNNTPAELEQREEEEVAKPGYEAAEPSELPVDTEDM